MAKRIGILTGGGDVPGLNAAVKAFVWRMDHSYEIVGLRRGWASLLNIVPDPGADNSASVMPLNRLITRSIDRAGGTILHTSRVNPSISKGDHIPVHLRGQMGEPDEPGRYDLTRAALRAIEFLELDALSALGGDGTMTFGLRLPRQGVPAFAIPNPLHKHAFGPDYNLGSSTA